MTVLTLARPRVWGGAKAAGRRPAVGCVIRVARGQEFIGEVVLDERERVRSHAGTIPPDVVLKVLVMHTRHDEVMGKLTGRKDGASYLWHIVGAEGF